MDEWLRYRYGSVRDANGRLIAVVPSLPDFPNVMFMQGFVALEQQSIYILRFLEKIYFTRVFMLRLYDIYALRFPLRFENIFGPQRSAQPFQEYKEEIAYFRARLSEMIDRLQSALGQSDRLILTHHPHFLHVGGKESERYNATLSDILEEEAHQRGVLLYNALDDFQAIHGDDPAAVFRWPEDSFSHLTAAGYVAYGHRIAEKFDPVLRALLRM